MYDWKNVEINAFVSIQKQMNQPTYTWASTYDTKQEGQQVDLQASCLH